MKLSKKEIEYGKKARQAFIDLEDFSMIVFEPVKKTTRVHSQTLEQFKCHHPKRITVH